MSISREKIELLLFIEILFLPLFIKMYGIYTSFENQNISLFQIFIHDSIIILLILFLSYISYIQKYFSKTLRLLALMVFILYLADFFILHLFATHLTVNDFIKFIDYAPKYISQEFNFSFSLILLLIAFFLTSILFIIRDYAVSNKNTHIVFIVLFMSVFSLNLYSKEDSYIHSWIYKNFIEYNLEIMSQSRDYSDSFIENFDYKEQKESINTQLIDKNIIILMVESLSSYQSKLFSGINDWTPNLDKIAQNNIFFKNFYANGFITEDAEIALLTGQLPIFAPDIYSNAGGVSFNGFYNIKDSLPFILKKHAYRSEFITSSDLDFSNTGAWAKSIGFDYMEGSEHKDYDGLQRYHFDAAEDKYLYKRVLSRIDANKDDKYFMFIKTVSSHVPFVNPENNNYDEEETIRYIDKEIGKFYEELEKQGYFKNGMLVIVGDHHPTMPVKKEAIEKFGINKASSITPMILSFGGEKKGAIDDPFSQVDVYHTLRSYLTGNSSISKWNGNFSDHTNPVPPSYIVFKRADRRGVVSVFGRDFETNILLNGDDTKLLDKNVDDKNVQKEIIGKINYERIFKTNNDIDGFEIKRIAHAAGGIDNKTYTNSYEALDRNIKKGFKYFEIDFSFTSDDNLVCLHDWNSFDKKLTIDEFEKTVKNKFGYTMCTLDGLAKWMEENEDAVLVTDVKSDNLKALNMILSKVPNPRDRVVPQIYDPGNFEDVKKMGFNQIIWTLYRYDGTNKDVLKSLKKFYGPVAVTMPVDRAKKGLGKLLDKKDIPSYVHTINSVDNYNILKTGLGISEIYTDFLNPDYLK